MKNFLFTYLLPCLLIGSAWNTAKAMETDTTSARRVEIAFASDTQEPMWIETVYLRPRGNTKATACLFADIARQKPLALYLLGDVVSLGYSNRKWNRIDQCVGTCRNGGTSVYALLGNHDVMGRARKGESNFQKRFPEHIRTGYVKVTDSIAVVMLNSNFGKLSAADVTRQQQWYESTLAALEADAAVHSVIVTCHHPPFTNSKLVASSKLVQQRFVPAFVQSRKCRLFITGHSHAFEHFKMQGKDFLIIGGGGGLHHPLNTSLTRLADVAEAYKPMFHYLTVKRLTGRLSVTSHVLKNDFSGFEKGYGFDIPAL